MNDEDQQISDFYTLNTWLSFIRFFFPFVKNPVLWIIINAVMWD